MLRINALVHRIAGRTLLDGATLAVPDGQRAALVGRNGTGKTTLLRLIAGEIEPDGGTIAVHPGARVAMVAQTAPAGAQSVIETVLAADHERSRLLAEADVATEPGRIADIQTRLADIAAHSAPARAGAILHGLGFDSDAQARPLDAFSGGWRMRVALATVLFAEPDLLLLDEPTNHLDLEATLWLEQFLGRWPRTLVMVSHDRDLVNRVARRTIHLDRRRLTAYAGGFDAFERARRERLELDAKTRAKQAAKRRHIQAFVDRFRAQANKARQAQSRIKALERLPAPMPVINERPVILAFPEPLPLAPPLITLDEAAVGYAADRAVLDRLNLRIDMDDRIALIGANGNGKTTLARLLAGRLAPMAGGLIRANRLEVGYFAQDQADALRAGATPIEHLAALLPDANETALRARLGRFALAEDQARTTVDKLSGGERARLCFALVSAGAPQILVLDEPSNHLDVDARAALEDAINGYRGAVILITHDRRLIELCADRLWLVADGTCRPFDGDLDDYRKFTLSSRARPREAGAAKAKTRPSAKTTRREKAAARAATEPLRARIKAAEAEIASLGAEKAQIEARLADPGLYDQPSQALADLTKRQSALARRLAEAEEAWLEASQALDGAA